MKQTNMQKLQYLVSTVSHLELDNLSSMTGTHWRRRMENIIHFVCTIKFCSLQDEVTKKNSVQKHL